MKKGLSRLTFSETTRRIITIAIYAFFTIYTLYKLLQEPSPEGKICYGLLLIIFMGGSTLGGISADSISENDYGTEYGL